MDNNESRPKNIGSEANVQNKDIKDTGAYDSLMASIMRNHTAAQMRSIKEGFTYHGYDNDGQD